MEGVSLQIKADKGDKEKDCEGLFCGFGLEGKIFCETFKEETKEKFRDLYEDIESMTQISMKRHFQEVEKGELAK